MDKLKFKTKIKDSLDESIITNIGYEAKKSSFDPLKNNYTRPYYNPHNHVTVAWDNFNLKLEFNPTIYIKGHNVNMCSLEECISAVDALGIELDVNLWGWDIVGYDFNVTIQVEFPCASYLPIFQESPKYMRMMIEGDTGKNYESGGKNRNRSITIYNKITEASKKKIIIPKNLIGKNLLRIEHSVINRIRDYKCFESVQTVTDFLVREQWNNASRLFLKTYTEIRKHELKGDANGTSTPPNFSNTQKGKLHDILDIGDIEKYVIEQQIKVGKELLTTRHFKSKIKQARDIWNSYVSYNLMSLSSSLNEFNAEIENELRDNNSLLNELNDKVNNEIEKLIIK